MFTSTYCHRVLRLAQLVSLVGSWRQHVGPRRCFTRGSLVMMPEGPECKSLAEGLDLQLGGSRYVLDDVSLTAGRYSYEGSEPKDMGRLRELLAPPARAKSPQTLLHVKSKGKFIWFDFRDVTLWSTLGLTGGWTFNADKRHMRLSLAFSPSAQPYSSIPLTAGAQRRLYFYDMRNFGTLRVSFDRAELADKLQELGHDWLDPASRPSLEEFLALGAKASKYKRPLAVFLMDQKKTSGIGNYVLSEVLWKTRIHPQARCADIDKEGWEDLYAAIASTLQESYASQSPLLSSTAAYRHFRFDVYAQKVTPSGTPVVRVEGPHKRTVHHCPLTQTRFRPPPEE